MSRQHSADNPLQTLLDIERSIAEQFAAEQNRARPWLEAKQVEISAQSAREEENLQIRQQTCLAETIKATKTEAEMALQKAAALQAKLAAIDPASCRELILHHLTAILPRSQHDRKDVKN